MLCDSKAVSSAIHALETYRELWNVAHEQRDDDDSGIVAEVLRQEQAIRALLPDDWSIEYNAPFYQINLFK